MQSIRSETLERIEQIVRDLLGDDGVALTAETRPKEVAGWDSLANVSIVFGIDEDFGVQLGEALSSFETVGDLVALVDRARAR